MPSLHPPVSYSIHQHRPTGILAGVILATALFALCARGASGDSSTAGAGPYWVFFRDRGGQRLDPAEILNLAESVPAASWARRWQGSGAAMPEEKDLPVWQPYVDSVAAYGSVRHRSRWLNAVSVQLTPGAARLVAALPFVTRVGPVAHGDLTGLGPDFAPDGRPLNRTVPLRSPHPAGVYPYGPSYGQLEEIGVPEMHALGYTANRVMLMMLDTGFRKTHHAFRHTRIVAERDWVFHDGQTMNQPDDYWWQQYHGTGTFAVLAGYDPGNLVGPAYGASIVLSKTEDVLTENRVEEDNYVAALEWADSLGVQVTSSSLGYLCFDDGFCYNYPTKNGHIPVISEAIEIAATRGICCVNAAGNNGPAPLSLITPADADSVISVAAVDSTDQIAGFSSRGPSDDLRIKPEVAARGVSTLWADASADYAYGYADGTSLSTPLVGGSAGLLREAHPEWGPMDVRNALMMTADKHTSPGNDYGWGRINVPAAMNYTPVVYAYPFSLLSPADSDTVAVLSPSLAWHSTRTPGLPGSVTYAVSLWDPSPGGQRYEFAAGTDTFVAVPFALQPATWYQWEVQAQNSLGNRRTSRETWALFTPVVSGVAPAGGNGPRIRELTVGPNPFRNRVSFVAHVLLSRAAGAKTEWGVYDPLGRKVAGAALTPSGDGTVAAEWNARDALGREAAAGVYYLELRCGAQVLRRTLVRLPSSNAG